MTTSMVVGFYRDRAKSACHLLEVVVSLEILPTGFAPVISAFAGRRSGLLSYESMIVPVGLAPTTSG